MKKYFLMMSLFLGALLMVSCGDNKSKSSSDDDDEDDEEQTEERATSKKHRSNRDADYNESRNERSSRSESSSRRGGSAGEAQAVVEKFLTAMMNHDVDDLLSCVDQERMKRKSHGNSLEEEAEEELNRHDGVCSFYIGSIENCDRGEYRVRANVVFNDGYSTTMGYKVVEKGGRWVIAN